MYFLIPTRLPRLLIILVDCCTMHVLEVREMPCFTESWGRLHREGCWSTDVHPEGLPGLLQAVLRRMVRRETRRYKLGR